MHTKIPAWYCARTKPEPGHMMAAANVCKNPKLKVVNPRLRVQRVTQRGAARFVEPLFPCCIFIHCVIEERLNEVQHTNGSAAWCGSSTKFPSRGHDHSGTAALFCSRRNHGDQGPVSNSQRGNRCRWSLQGWRHKSCG